MVASAGLFAGQARSHGTHTKLGICKACVGAGLPHEKAGAGNKPL